MPSAVLEALAGRYAIAGELGRGAVAIVYEARDLRHNRDIAIKLLHHEASAVFGGSRFRREIEVVARLQHPHIVPLYDSGEAAGLLYYVMPLMRGGSLRAKLKAEGRMPPRELIRILADVRM